MKIGRLEIKQFKCYEDEEILFNEPLSIIRGSNTGGKTSIAQAIQLSFTPQCAGTDPRGAGADDKIKLGADKAIITLGVDTARGPMQIVTTYGPGKKGREQRIIPGNGGPDNKALVEGFEKFLLISRDRLGCIADSRYFITEKPAEQKAILAALVLPTSHQFDPEIVALVEKHFGAFNWASNPVALIDQVYAGAYEARKAAKAGLAAIYLPAAPEQPEYPDQKGIQDGLYDLRKRAAAEAAKIKRGDSSKVGRLEAEIAQHEARATTLAAEIEKLRATLTEIQAARLAGPAIGKHQKIAAGRAKLDELQGKLDANSRKIEEAFTAQEIYRNMLTEGVCERCTQPISAEFVNGKIAAFSKEIDAASEVQKKLTAERKALGDVAGAEQILAAQIELEAEQANKQAQLKDAEARSSMAAGAIKDLQSALTQARAADQKPADTSALDAVNAEIAVWEARLGPAVQYEATIKQIEQATAKRAEQQAKVDDLEKLCDEFGPKGIKAKLIAEHIGNFNATMNDVFAAWGYEARLTMEPYSFDFRSPKSAPYFLPVKEASGMEGLGFAVALQAAVAIYSKIRMVVVDQCDVMEGMQRNRLLGALKSLVDEGKLDQAIVLVADSTRVVKPKDGVAYYFVENGKVERL